MRLDQGEATCRDLTLIGGRDRTEVALGEPEVVVGSGLPEQLLALGRGDREHHLIGMDRLAVVAAREEHGDLERRVVRG